MRNDICYEICGDGKDLGYWWCDDGNNEAGDGCDAYCHVERGYSCTGGTSVKADTCTEICGDGVDHLYYQCDDGNLVAGDGCDGSCNIETGWTCFGGTYDTADRCFEICGDSIRVSTKTGVCDDGNVIALDGCSRNCEIETGWTCTGGTITTRDVCTEICGDGLHRGQLKCDDGNVKSGDGCSSVCAIEKGYTCTGGTIYTADSCTEICGDGYNYGVWACDDGNSLSGDGCSSKCAIEREWFCWGGSKTGPDLCRLLPKPLATSISVDTTNSLATINFNETMMLDKDWKVADLLVYIEGPKKPYAMTWSLKD